MVKEMRHFQLSDVKNGDILFWDGSNAPGMSGIYLKIVRLMTVSGFGHVSVAWRQNTEELMHVEATQPCVRLNPVLPTDSFYCVSIDKVVSDQQLGDFFKDKIGCKYSFRDAVYSYLGLCPKADNRWQCVELANYFCRHIGLEVGNAFVPADLMDALVYAGMPLHLVKGN